MTPLYMIAPLPVLPASQMRQKVVLNCLTVTRIRTTSTSSTMLLLRSLLGLFLTRTPPTPTPTPASNLSIGEEYTHARIGPARCWQAVGPVRAMFETLSRRILLILADWEASDDAFIGWSIYMIGPSEEAAVPTLVVHGDNVAARKSVCQLIRDSGILQQYRILLDDRQCAPDFNRVDPLQYFSGTASHLFSQQPAKASSAIQELEGSSIFIHHRDGTTKQATVGVIFQIDGRLFGTTVAHAFVTPKNTPLPEIGVDLTSTLPFTITSALGIQFGNPILFADADYALVEIIPPAELPFSLSVAPTLGELQLRMRSQPLDRKVSVSAGQGSLSGKLSGTSTFIRLPGTNGFKEVWTASLDCQLKDGDCGSMLADAEDGRIYGHVVVGSPSSSCVYILPAIQLLQSIAVLFPSAAASSPPHRNVDIAPSSNGMWELPGFSWHWGKSVRSWKHLIYHFAAFIKMIALLLIIISLYLIPSKAFHYVLGDVLIENSTVPLTIGNCSLGCRDQADASGWGLGLMIADKNLCVSPSTIVNNTQLFDCLEFVKLSQAKASADTNFGSPSWTLPLALNPQQRNQTLQVYIANGSFHLHTGDKREEAVTLTPAQGSLPTTGALGRASHLGLASADFLSSLRDMGKISARSFGLNVGSQYGQHFRTGSLVLGGWDHAFDKEAMEFPLPEPGALRNEDFCELPVRMQSLSLRGGDPIKHVEILRDVPACIKPFNKWTCFPDPKTLQDIANFASGSDGSRLRNACIEPYDKLFSLTSESVARLSNVSLDFVFTRNAFENFTFSISISRRGEALWTADQRWKTSTDAKSAELRAHNSTAMGGMVILGRDILSELYLSVDYDAGKFALAPLHGVESTQVEAVAANHPPHLATSVRWVGYLLRFLFISGGISLVFACLVQPSPPNALTTLLQWFGSPQTSLTNVLWQIYQTSQETRRGSARIFADADAMRILSGEIKPTGKPIIVRNDLNWFHRCSAVFIYYGLAAYFASFAAALAIEAARDRNDLPPTYVAVNMLLAWLPLLAVAETSRPRQNIQEQVGAPEHHCGKKQPDTARCNFGHQAQRSSAPSSIAEAAVWYLSAFSSSLFVWLCILSAAVTGLPEPGRLERGENIWAASLIIYGVLGSATWLILMSGRTGIWLERLAGVFKCAALLTLIIMFMIFGGGLQHTRNQGACLENRYNPSLGTDTLAVTEDSSYAASLQKFWGLGYLRHKYLEFGTGILTADVLFIRIISWYLRHDKPSVDDIERQKNMHVQRENRETELAQNEGRRDVGSGLSEKC